MHLHVHSYLLDLRGYRDSAHLASCVCVWLKFERALSTHSSPELRCFHLQRETCLSPMQKRSSPAQNVLVCSVIYLVASDKRVRLSENTVGPNQCQLLNVPLCFRVVQLQHGIERLGYFFALPFWPCVSRLKLLMGGNFSPHAHG